MPVLVKSALLAASLCSLLFGSKPPRPPATQDTILRKDALVERAFAPRLMTILWQAVFCSTIASHIAVLLTLNYQFFRLNGFTTAVLCPSSSTDDPLPALSSLSATFLLGTAFALAGGTLRRWCYATLGRLFTFEVTLQPDHTLVTHGPYTYMRHPSYTGNWLLMASTALLFFGKSEYVAVCGLKGTWFGWMQYLWIILASFSSLAVWRRADAEDVLLEDKFGEKWKAWKADVPWKFVPYVW